ncbi:hypothetical protein H0H92_006934 [Tricholoma furcatifolium]|nr:hypothetical protein H0H92_006934 [Tricholoma furcatifolium]
MSVKNALELLGLFLDYTLAIRYLMKHNVMHRDISPANLMISFGKEDMNWYANLRQPLSTMLSGIDGIDSGIDMGALMYVLGVAQCRRGVLIDFDYASLIDLTKGSVKFRTMVELELEIAEAKRLALSKVTSSTVDQCGGGGSAHESSDSAHAHEGSHGSGGAREGNRSGSARTGTAPYMAIPLLLGSKQHTVAYDLESLFYALIFVATHVTEEGTSESSCPAVSAWFKCTDFRSLAATKIGQFHHLLNVEILPYLQPQFQCLRPYLYAMWTALYPPATISLGAYPLIVFDAPGFSQYWRIPDNPMVPEPRECCDEFISIIIQAIYSMKGPASSKRAKHG